MRILRRLAVLVLPVVVLMSLGTPAHAALSAYITNAASSGIGIGVIHKWDGSYVHGRYDAILPAGQRTDQYLGWEQADGFYIGPGYCAHLYLHDGTYWLWRDTMQSDRQVKIGPTHGGVWRWKVEAFRC
jgi:hypothetical protein